MKRNRAFIVFLLSVILYFPHPANAQRLWAEYGDHYYEFSEKGIETVDPRNRTRAIFLPQQSLIPQGTNKPIEVENFTISKNKEFILIYTNSKRVWRENTRGDYWIYSQRSKQLRQLGQQFPASQLMFAKFSPRNDKVAYVNKADHNIYIEDLTTGKITAVTTDGTDRIINGTFDWVYEEEFGCKDGFRWSPDGLSIAYWKLDARHIRNFLMINNTDSLYSYTIPVEYPKVGQSPSSCSIWIYELTNSRNNQVLIPGTPDQNYVPRMEWCMDSKQLILQQLNRKQNESKIYTASVTTYEAQLIYQEKSDSWIDIKSRWNNNDPAGWDWIQNGKAFIWVSEKDGWRKIYQIDLKGKEKLITQADYDVINLDFLDPKGETIYFTASPTNATQKYLYSVPTKGGIPKRLTPMSYEGTCDYDISADGSIALFRFSNRAELKYDAVVALPSHQVLMDFELKRQKKTSEGIAEFFKIKTADSVELDGWMVKPLNFDPSKKYPVVFMVYGEPASQTVLDNFSAGYNSLYKGNMAQDGYLYISLDNRGTPSPKGSSWRKSIYRKIGLLNIRDQALSAQEILKWPFVDSSRVAVWGWSGGGSSTLNLLGQYPQIYKTGIAIAAVANQLLYDNVYQERYMGLPQENKEDFENGSPLKHVKNIRGNLLYIHGTGDDNVHYQNAEVLINELIRNNVQFQLMSYPNRSHSISEGEGTHEHLRTLFTNYLRLHCPPGGR
ncbi:DPP IV N-terminal domain-containing protein [Sphingobacterium sp. InxBP1]|uniref:S9 family peptidase n=1 Tax=Sphingobacterium sp. InxBP1 TaxID=2870328 RepID=UPI002244AE04|nr:DPP IV N-terminal domain-containing protein [Sphingobacterium sp. InxBP1]MCW8311370.1 DPP IV N-terminal domain-containing protein [Sphingobacterium sp. InxBP1]